MGEMYQCWVHCPFECESIDKIAPFEVAFELRDFVTYFPIQLPFVPQEGMHLYFQDGGAFSENDDGWKIEFVKIVLDSDGDFESFFISLQPMGLWQIALARNEFDSEPDDSVVFTSRKPLSDAAKTWLGQWLKERYAEPNDKEA